MSASVTPVATDAPVPRPLYLLEMFIHDELQKAHEAGLEHYRKAGLLLLEAKSQLRHGEFTAWIEARFDVSPRQARQYMYLAEQAAAQNGSALPFSSLSDCIRQTKNPNYNVRPAAAPPPMPSADLRDRLQRDQAERAQRERERQAFRTLALQVVTDGYRLAAKRLHPDRSDGSTEEMARLNRVRDFLKQAIARE